jgi:phosphoenolpyruvate carboxylase
MVRAFSYFSPLANIAEDQHHSRRRLTHLLAFQDSLRHVPAGYLRIASLSNELSVFAIHACAFLVDRIGRRRWAVSCFII